MANNYELKNYKFSEKLVIGGAAAVAGGTALLGCEVLIDSNVGLHDFVRFPVVALGCAAIVGGYGALAVGIGAEVTEGVEYNYESRPDNNPSKD